MTRSLALAFLAGALLTGCSRKPSAPDPTEAAKAARDKAEREQKAAGERMNVATTEGTADWRDPKGDARLYSVAWKSSALTLGRSGLREGAMNDVSGTVYEADRAKSTFTAKKGYAKRETQTLYLEGQVVVKSPQYQATLRAQKLEWLPDVKRYRATGGVTLSTPTGISGPMPELLATSDLRRFGTPDMFDQR